MLMHQGSMKRSQRGENRAPCDRTSPWVHHGSVSAKTVRPHGSPQAPAHRAGSSSSAHQLTSSTYRAVNESSSSWLMSWLDSLPALPSRILGGEAKADFFIDRAIAQ
ncbi:hypothetical protein PIB30_108629, partial [Stylosanthes scabra]|nr:hypothetical protein [Stylosanthes scabra]